jgi:hypothetical protein
MEVIFEENSRLQKIDKWAFQKTGITEITIPAGVEEIGDECFWGCRNLRDVTFEDSSKLQRIGAHSFACTRIGGARIPSHVEITETAPFSSIFCIDSMKIEITDDEDVSFRAKSP